MYHIGITEAGEVALGLLLFVVVPVTTNQPAQSSVAGRRQGELRRTIVVFILGVGLKETRRYRLEKARRS